MFSTTSSTFVFLPHDFAYSVADYTMRTFTSAKSMGKDEIVKGGRGFKSWKDNWSERKEKKSIDTSLLSQST